MLDLKSLLFSLEGKINRKEYLWGNLCLLLMGLIYFIFYKISAFFVGFLASILSLIFIPLIFFGHVSINIKRLRDIGWSTWLILLYFVPFIMHVMQILGLIIPGKTVSRNSKKEIKTDFSETISK